jgi:GT2 family glycosyltransferase
MEGSSVKRDDSPIAIRTIELSEPFAAITDVTGYARTRVYVTDRGALLGGVEIDNMHGGISVTTLRDAIADRLAGEVMRRAFRRQLEARADVLPPDVRVSIVVPTCGRPDELRRCLTALRRQRTSRAVEIIVVDNRPGPGSQTPAVVRECPGVVLCVEPRAGLSYARNAGFAVASGEIVVATDDDVTVPDGWLERLVAPFARPEVMAATGPVLPIELETRAQRRFEAYGGLGRGFQRREFDGRWFRACRGAVPTWQIGATANAAFRPAVFRDPAIGPLDERLGPGTPTGVGEDTYLFYRILKAGHTIVYDPGGWVWHRHRRDDAALRQQICGYSKGHVAYHLHTWLQDGDRRALVRLVYSLPKAFARRLLASLRGRSDYPASLILTEIASSLAGPWALRQSRRRARLLMRDSGPDHRLAHDGSLPERAVDVHVSTGVE